ncbi:hypothetical protein [Candidatus Thiodiazotropha sp. CDECU1]|uniref:hypothetical protein n=1 Tax=Candidatus Thiodiazotropha sp. CDECU1 TaxID=3065865 RepID=UPI002930E72B|nr:hypothetical protein [Candidatus Thiodiazotropha sp. CDECU1]
MSKIDFDASAYQAERAAGTSMDLARRLEWRQQWEKAQIENWQAGHHVRGRRAVGAGSSTEAGVAGLKETDETKTQTHPALEKSSMDTEPRRSNYAGRGQSRMMYDSSGPKEVKSATTYAPASPMVGGGKGHGLSVSAKSLPTVRTPPPPLVQQPHSTGIHIYQADGKVEVALRNTGINGRDGVMLMTGLKKDLASLGLRLTRLILNGELLWQSEAATPRGSVSADTDADETPIDKIY